MAPKSPKKIVVFISYTSEENEVAKALRDTINTHFRGMVEAFASSIPIGEDWFGTIKDNLRECNMLITIASPLSVTRPWILFESGAAFGRDTGPISICHAGMTPSDLPSPLKHLQSANATDTKVLDDIFKKITDLSGGTHATVDFTGFLAAVSEYQPPSLNITPDSINTSKLTNREVGVLRSILESGGHVGSTNYHAVEKQMMGYWFTAADTKLGLGLLQAKEFITLELIFDYNFERDYQHIYLTKKAWLWYDENPDVLSEKRLEEIRPPLSF